MAAGIKGQARELVDRLPDDASWDDLMRAIHDRIAVERGLADFEAGRVVGNDEVRRRFGLPA